MGEKNKIRSGREYLLLKTELDIKKIAIEFINTQHIMTIATSDNQSPWAAPLYYIFHGSAFYFFSKSSSKHITDALKTKKAAASIHFQSTGWADIRGIQMTGKISDTGINKKSGLAFNAYLKKFDFIGEIKTAVTLINDITSVESAFKVKFYKFTPELIYYLDNNIEFGFKEVVTF